MRLCHYFSGSHLLQFLNLQEIQTSPEDWTMTATAADWMINSPRRIQLIVKACPGSWCGHYHDPGKQFSQNCVAMMSWPSVWPTLVLVTETPLCVTVTTGTRGSSPGVATAHCHQLSHPGPRLAVEQHFTRVPDDHFINWDNNSVSPSYNGAGVFLANCQQRFVSQKKGEKLTTIFILEGD